tara:strand:- start:157 stop:1089 length:933 start_codon:yes stop_codon:yes gene_type:complete
MDEMRRVLSSEIILPWCGREEGKCNNIKKNGGLYTQCEKLKEGEYCKVCDRIIEKNGGVAKYGTVSDREKCDIMDYMDPSSGKKPSSYSDYMKKNKLTMEEVEQYGKMCGVVVQSCHFEENKISRGRPKKEVSVVLENVEKKKRGRPKKEKQVVANGAGEELIASLMSLPSLPSLPTAELRCPDVVLSESNIERKDEITNKEVSSIPSSESEAPQPSTDNDEKSEAPQPPADKPPTDNDEKSEAPQPSADTADEDEDEETVVVKFDINGITYLKSQDNVIYDMNTHDALGVWNEETSEIDVLPEEDDEEE